MAENNIELKSINDLSGMNFFIPSYQRGYQWTSQQIIDLLEDIENFINNKKPDGFYCIQPLVVRELKEYTFTKKDEAKTLEEVKNLLKGRWEVIDGQQRLTTIYILLACLGEKKPYSIEYETRGYLTDFLHKIAEIPSLFRYENIDFYNMIQAREAIKNWLDCRTGRENDFKNTLLNKVKFIWFESAEKDPISVYIKMNARGEQLTSYENFKADFIGYIKSQNWNDLLNPTEGVPIKMNTTWTDIFWKNSTNEKLDDIYFAFLNRFFLNELITKRGNEEDGYAYSAKSLNDQKDITFNHLYGDKSDDSKISYTSFDTYKSILSEDILNSLKNTLDNFFKLNLHENSKLFYPNWDEESNFRFIPEYTNDKNKPITTLTQQQRVVFFAICKYFEKGGYNETSLKQWMRVVWNIVENDSAGWIGCMRLIDELSEHSHNIYEFLANDANSIKSDADPFEDQVAEEREKAKKIIEDKEWESILIESEKHDVLKGKVWICFLDNSNTTKDVFRKAFEIVKRHI